MAAPGEEYAVRVVSGATAFGAGSDDQDIADANRNVIYELRVTLTDSGDPGDA